MQGFFAGSRPCLPATATAQAHGLPPPQALGRALALPASFTLPRDAGRPLPVVVRERMETHFRADFSRVRVHVGPEAPAIGALAFTVGDTIVFAPGQYDPDSPRGRQLLGHELTHVVQQRQGRVSNPFGHGLAVVQDPALEAEAEASGLRAALALNRRGPHFPAAGVAGRRTVQPSSLASSRPKRTAAPANLTEPDQYADYMEDDELAFSNKQIEADAKRAEAAEPDYFELTETIKRNGAPAAVFNAVYGASLREEKDGAGTWLVFPCRESKHGSAFAGHHEFRIAKDTKLLEGADAKPPVCHIMPWSLMQVAMVRAKARLASLPKDAKEIANAVCWFNRLNLRPGHPACNSASASDARGPSRLWNELLVAKQNALMDYVVAVAALAGPSDVKPPAL